jgi:tetratricopeptide (TPR) repeat protein
MNNDKISRTNQDTNSTLEELSGFLDIGMKRQSLKVVRKILAKHRVTPVEFNEAVRTLGMFLSVAGMLKWSEMLETAYARQSERSRRAMNGSMLKYYASLNDPENAARFLSADQMKSPEDAFLVMDVLLETKRMDEAKQLATRFENLLRRKHDRFTFALLITALAEYYERVGDWDQALNLWHHAPLEEPFRENALRGIVSIHLARALVSVRDGLQSLDSLKKSPDQENSLSLPGNDDGITQHAEKILLRFKHGIEKLLPVKSRSELGFAN